MGRVQAQRTAKVSEKVIAGNEVLASSRSRVDAHASVLVEAGALTADSPHERETDTCDLARVYGVYVPENRTIVQNALIKTFGCLP